ncbi:hypothetical protein TELCIR_21424, partial [Teladorsagia circumcincta]
DRNNIRFQVCSCHDVIWKDTTVQSNATTAIVGALIDLDVNSINPVPKVNCPIADNTPMNSAMRRSRILNTASKY